MPLFPGVHYTDHTLTVPLDHADPGGPAIEVFAREIVAPQRAQDDLPWLVYLQGGPGGLAPRPVDAGHWIGRALKTHRVLLLDQRGSGRSTPVDAAAVAGMDDRAIAAYLAHFRGDSIVRDAEAFRAALLGDRQWETLGQSYGGWVTASYLSLAPEALRACYVTGGLPPLTARAEDVYRRTYPRVATKNAAYYARYPDDAALLRGIADHLQEQDVRLPDGDRLTVRRLRMLGQKLGMSDGYESVHWLLERACGGAGRLAAGFLYDVMAWTASPEGPIYALQEPICYAAPGAATGWAAAAVLADLPEFAEDADPLLLTGEMMYPWMFEDIAALRPFAGAARIMAERTDWPALWDLDVLSRNEVPVLAAVYFDDMYVDSGLQLDTAAAVPNVRAWVTNEFEHNGLRAGDTVLSRLLDMAAGEA